MIRIIILAEIILAFIFAVVWAAAAVLFLMAEGFGSPLEFAFFVMGLLIVLVGFYLMTGWVRGMTRDWRYL